MINNNQNHQQKQLHPKSLSNLIGQNRQLITQLPTLLIKHLEIYQKIHESHNEQSKFPFNQSVESQINMLKECSIKFGSHLASIKNNLNVILTKQNEIGGRFIGFINQQCQGVVRDKLEKLKVTVGEDKMYDPEEYKL